jgi:hypothetical protein
VSGRVASRLMFVVAGQVDPSGRCWAGVGGRSRRRREDHDRFGQLRRQAECAMEMTTPLMMDVVADHDATAR